MTYISCKHCRCRSKCEKIRDSVVRETLWNPTVFDEHGGTQWQCIGDTIDLTIDRGKKTMQIESNQYTLDIDEWSNQTHGRLTSKKPANSFHSVSIPWKILLKSKNIQTSNIPIDIKLHGNIMKSFFYPKQLMTYFHRALNWLQGSSPNSTFTAWSVWLGWLHQLKGWLFSPQLPIGENGHSNGLIMWTCAYYTLEAFFFPLWMPHELIAMAATMGS